MGVNYVAELLIKGSILFLALNLLKGFLSAFWKRCASASRSSRAT